MAFDVTDGIQAVTERDHYLDLVRGFPLRPLRTDDDLAQAVAMIDSLVIRNDLDRGEQDYLDVLTDIVEKYEDDEHPMRRATDDEMLRSLMDDRKLNQVQVAEGTGIAVSTINEILNGKRRMTRTHIVTIARFFGVRPIVFNL